MSQKRDPLMIHPVQPTKVRVMTLNCWGVGAGWPQRAPLIRREISACSPDIIGVQEVMRHPDGGEPDQPRDIVQGHGYQVTYARARGHGPNDELQYGNAILSRWPVVSSEVFMLPVEIGDDETRALLYCLVQMPFGLLPVFVTHLSHQAHLGDMRAKQLMFIMEKIDRLTPLDGPHLPPIFMGDMNAPPDSPEMRRLCPDGEETYSDCWRTAGDGSTGATYAQSRIDYIFVRTADRHVRATPTLTRLACMNEEDGVLPSDHRGVLTEVEFR